MRAVIFDQGGKAVWGVMLSPRQVAVGRALLTGIPLKQIAHGLGMSHNTLSSYLTDIGNQLVQPSGRRLCTRGEISRFLYTYPEVLAGCAVPPTLHQDGCDCPAHYCSVQRIADVRVPLSA